MYLINNDCFIVMEELIKNQRRKINETITYNFEEIKQLRDTLVGKSFQGKDRKYKITACIVQSPEMHDFYNIMVKGKNKTNKQFDISVNTCYDVNDILYMIEEGKKND